MCLALVGVDFLIDAVAALTLAWRDFGKVNYPLTFAPKDLI